MQNNHCKIFTLIAATLILASAAMCCALIINSEDADAINTGSSSDPVAFIETSPDQLRGHTFYLFIYGKININAANSWTVTDVTDGFGMTLNPDGSLIGWPNRTGTLTITVSHPSEGTGTCTVNVVNLEKGTSNNPLDRLELCATSFLQFDPAIISSMSDLTEEEILNEFNPTTFYLEEGAPVTIYYFHFESGDGRSQVNFDINFNSVTNNYGLNIDGGGISGTISETGTIQFSGEFYIDLKLNDVVLMDGTYPVDSQHISTIESVGETPVTSISISGLSSGEVGDTITLTATSSPSSADNRGVTFEITSGSSRATITSQSETSTGGRCTIELESAGSITVTATASDGSGVTRTKTITIYEPEVLVTSVSISGSSTVQVGSTVTLTATTSPSNADDRTVNWSITSGTSHVSYTTSDTSTGGRIVLTGLSAGTVTVRATAADGSGEYATKTITVQAADVEITSSQGDTTISTGTAFSYVVNTNVSGCTISVSGADWLQVSGNTVYGTPTEAGDFDITITASRSGYTSDTQNFTIKVVSSLSFTSVPTTGLIIVEV